MSLHTVLGMTDRALILNLYLLPSLPFSLHSFPLLRRYSGINGGVGPEHKRSWLLRSARAPLCNHVRNSSKLATQEHKDNNNEENPSVQKGMFRAPAATVKGHIRARAHRLTRARVHALAATRTHAGTGSDPSPPPAGMRSPTPARGPGLAPPQRRPRLFCNSRVRRRSLPMQLPRGASDWPDPGAVSYHRPGRPEPA